MQMGAKVKEWRNLDYSEMVRRLFMTPGGRRYEHLPGDHVSGDRKLYPLLFILLREP